MLASAGEDNPVISTDGNYLSGGGDPAISAEDNEEVKSKNPVVVKDTSQGHNLSPVSTNEESANITMETDTSLISRQASIDENLRRSSGFMFITRPDLYKFAKVCCHAYHMITT